MKYIWRQLLYLTNPLMLISLLHLDLICDDVKLFVSDISLSMFAEMYVWWCYPYQAILDKKEYINI